MPDTLNMRLSLRNSLLAALPAEETDFIKSGLETVHFASGDILFQAGDQIRYVYFPNDGMISLLSVTEQGQTVEVGFTGCEGMIGLPLVLGQNEMPYQAMAQIASECYRVEARTVLKLFKTSEAFREIVLRYLYLILRQVSQTCICNHFHTIEARLCRWLAVMCERSGKNHLALTQEFLSQMLGVQRTSIGLIANSLQNAGIISYRRGKIEIVDLARLKKSSCECLKIITDENNRFLKSKNLRIMSDS